MSNNIPYRTSPEARPEKPMERGAQIKLVLVAIVLVLVIFGLAPRVWIALFPPPPESPPHPYDGSFQASDKQWKSLRFETVHLQSFDDVVTTDGQIAVDDDLTTQVFSPFTGRVTRIFVRSGDVVKIGAPLSAMVANEAGQSDADMLTATAQLQAARAEEARLRDLAAHQGAAQKDWDAAKANLAAAQGAMMAARERRSALGGSIGHGEALVRAPVSGVITQRLIGLGQNIASASGGSATQAFTISDFSKLWVVGNLREEDAMKAHIGQMARITLLADPAHPIMARLDYVAPQIDPATHRLTVRATLNNPGGTIKPQMFASFALLTGAPRTNLSVPESAVIYEGSSARVWVAKPGSHRLEVRQVTVGQTVGGQTGVEKTGDARVEITGGLRNGDTVVSAGSLFIDRGAHED